MIDLQKIKSLGVGSELIEFAEFLVKEKGERTFPDYRKIDLMKIPKLVPYVWVYDYRNGIEDGFLYHFSGTMIDAYFGFNVMGKTFEQCYSGKYQADLIRNVYNRVFLERKVGFTLRHDVFTIGSREKPRKIESLSFPCSTDELDLNFCMGITIYSHDFEYFDPTFRIL